MKNIFGKKHFNKWGLISIITLCSVLLTIGCPAVLDVVDNSPKIPKGIGTFSLQLEGSQTQGRTIMPGTGGTGNQFAFYKMDFIGLQGQPDVPVDFRTYSELSNPVQLQAGSYTLNVLAYSSAANRDANKPAASGSTSITIVENTPATGTITLTPYVVSGVKGIFDLNLTFTGDMGAGSLVDAVKMELQSISPTPEFNRTYTIIGTGSFPIDADEDIELDPGQYRVIFTLEKNGMSPVIWREVLHIAGNMTSSYTKEFTISHFVKKNYTISFSVDNAIIAAQTYFYDDDNVTSYTTTKAGHTFRGWYTSPALTTLYGFGTALTGDVTVYAWFQENLTGTVVLEITEDEDYIQTVVIDSLTGLNTGINEIDLTYQWFWNNILQQGATNNTYVVPENQAGGNFRIEIRHPDYFGYITASKGAPMRGESEDNPLFVNSIAALRLVGTGDFAAGGFWTKDAYYRQTANITVGGSAWTPISQRGGNTNPFIGNYNGDGFLIININWTSPSHFHDDLSLFGTIGTGGVVDYLIADSPRITGRDRLGVIASVNNGTIRRSVAFDSNVNGRNSIGVIAGENFGTIVNCYTTGIVFGHGAAAEGVRVGGIAGLNSAGTVELCYSTTTITGDDFVGGIVGQNNTGASVINCVALNPNITSRTTNAGRIGAGTGTFTTNRTRNDNPTLSIRITGGGSPAGHRGTDVAVPVAWTTVFPTATWTTGTAGNWIIPNPPTQLTLGQALPSLRLPPPIPPATQRFAPVPTLPAVRNRTAPNTATFNVDIRNFINFNREGNDGWWVKELQGEWVVGEMLEGRPSGPIDVPQAVNAAISTQAAHQYANNTAVRSFPVPNLPGVPNVGTIRLWGIAPVSVSGRVGFDFQLNFPFESAEIVFRVLTGGNLYNPTQQRYFCNRDNIEKTGWRYTAENASIITGTMYGSTYAAQNNGITQFDNGNFSMQVEIYVKTFGDWTYIPDNDVNVSDPIVIFRVDESEEDDNDYYWFDGETMQGQSSSKGSTYIFTNFNEVGDEFVPVFTPPALSEFHKVDGASQPIRRPLWVRTTRDDPHSTLVFKPQTGGPDRDIDELNYAYPLSRNKLVAEGGNPNHAVRITPNIVLNSGEIVGTAEIILVSVTTTPNNPTNPTDYVLSTTNPVEIEIILHLNESYAADLRPNDPVRLRSIPNTAISTIRGIDTIVRNTDTDATPNFTMIVPFINNNYSVGFVNTVNSAEITRFNRLANNTGGIVFQFNYQ